MHIQTAQLMEDLIGDLTSVPQPIEIKLFSESEETLHSIAPRVADAIRKVNGIIEVKDEIVPAGDAPQHRSRSRESRTRWKDPEAITKSLGDFDACEKAAVACAAERLI